MLGLLTPIVSGGVTTDFTNVGDMNLGRFTNSALYFTGSMDEARIHQGVDSSNWVWASYLTVASNSVFSSYGSVSDSVLPPVTITIQRQGNNVVLSWPQGTLQSGWFTARSLVEYSKRDFALHKCRFRDDAILSRPGAVARSIQRTNELADV